MNDKLRIRLIRGEERGRAPALKVWINGDPPMFHIRLTRSQLAALVADGAAILAADVQDGETRPLMAWEMAEGKI